MPPRPSRWSWSKPAANSTRSEFSRKPMRCGAMRKNPSSGGARRWGIDGQHSVMAGLVPAIHVFLLRDSKDVDARPKAGHDDEMDTLNLLQLLQAARHADLGRHWRIRKAGLPVGDADFAEIDVTLRIDR